jgi:hypothetical protein
MFDDEWNWAEEMRKIFQPFRAESAFNYKPKLLERIAGWFLLRKYKQILTN